MSDVKIGIYGGTFAPVHIGHIRSAYAFLSACNLDRLFIMPTNVTPRKTHCPGDDPKTRLHMLNIAFSSLPFYNDKVLISDYEIRNPGISYTYKTLEHFKFISNDLTLLCGTDNFLTLEKWKNFERIFELAKIAHIVRPGKQADMLTIQRMKEHYINSYRATIIDVPMAPIDISSTELREMIKNNIDTSMYIPRDVRTFIDNYNVYGEQDV